MADKDINIHVRTPGAAESREELGRFKKSVGDVGETVQKSNQQTQQSTEQVTQSNKKSAAAFDLIGSTVKKIKTELVGLITGYFGIQAAISLVTSIFEKFIEVAQRANDAMKEFNETSLRSRDVGQRLEFQTGTVGKQKDWTQAALELQKAGGLSDIQTAGSMMIAGDIAFGGQGGIKNPNVQSLLKQIAPFFGAAGIGPNETSKVFDFSQTAGVGANATDWMMYMARLQSGFTASKSTDFGGFMEGLQKGATPYMAGGGSLNEAISLFSGARAVTANEALSGTMLEQMTRLSSGAYEKPRKAMESALGVNWQNLSQDQRSSALLQYASSLPDSSRSQIMAEKGFSPELISSISRIVSPAGMATINATRQKVGGATPSLVAAQMQAFKDSPLGRSRETQASGDKVAVDSITDAMSQFEEDFKQAETEDKRRALRGSSEFLIPDRFEPTVIMLEKMRRKLETEIPVTPENEAALNSLSAEMDQATQSVRGLIVPFHYQAGFKQDAFKLAQRFYEIEKQSASVNITHNNNMIINQTPPAAGPRSSGGLR